MRSGMGAGVKLMLTTTLVAVVSVLIAHASEGVDYDEYTDFATHEGIERITPEETAVEEMPKNAGQMDELTQLDSEKRGNQEIGIEGQMKDAAAAVAVASKLLDADQVRAEALINKAEATGAVADQETAAAAVNQARRLRSNLLLAKAQLKSTTQQMKSLPVSDAALKKEQTEKDKVKKRKADKATAMEVQQKEYAKQYGIKATCHKKCTNKKVCQKTKCDTRTRKICVRSGPEQCAATQKCSKHVKQCEEVPTCVEKGPEQCDYPRECVKEARVCETKNVCVQKAEDCDKTFTPECIDCAKQAVPCQKALELAKGCAPSCQKQCKAGDAACVASCTKGCQKTYDGYLSACQKVCPACDETKLCSTKCARREPQEVCGTQCQKWQVAGEKVCRTPCAKMGKAKKCNDAFCSKYQAGPMVCDSECMVHARQAVDDQCQCAKWAPLKKEVCQEKCNRVKCKPDCAPTFHKQCLQRDQMRCHRPRTCAVKTIRKCEMQRGCARRGAEVCKPKKKCLAYENQCQPETKCAEHETSCASDFSVGCVACASKSVPCMQARKTGEKCLGKCKADCEGNETCMQRCKDGCQQMQRGLLVSCKDQCPACKKKEEVCQTTCKRTKQVNVCKKKCVQEVDTAETACFKPCLKYGQYEHCNPNFCSKYKYGKRVCQQPCVRYKASSTKWCKPKCEEVTCKKLCKYEPQTTCAKYKERCKSTQCVRRGLRCDIVDKCVLPGKESCTNSTTCLEYTKKCKDESTCVNSKTKCSPDTASCNSCRGATKACVHQAPAACIEQCQAACGSDGACKAKCGDGCEAISAGFSEACKAACPACAKPQQVCHEVCTARKLHKVCSKECAKSVLLGERQCTPGACLMMGKAKQCKPNACLAQEEGPKVCKKECVEHRTQLKKVCGTDCRPEPADTFDEYMKVTNATLTREGAEASCQGACYNLTYVCHSDKLEACTKNFRGNIVACLERCKAPPSPVAGDTYGMCLVGCAKSAPLAEVQQCKATKCAGLDAQELEECQDRCAEPRSRCKCACDKEKEFVCIGAQCRCRDGEDSGAKEAADAVAGAAVGTAGVIVSDPPSGNKDEGTGAQSVAEAAVKKAAQYGAVGHRNHEAATKKAKEEEELTMKQAGRQRQLMKSMMQEGALDSALRVAANTTFRTPAEQRQATLLAATTGAKVTSANMVKSLVKLVGVAASKTARAKAIALKKSRSGRHADEEAAVQAAVGSAMGPIMAMVGDVARNATTTALHRWPAHKGSFNLSAEAVLEIHDTAYSAGQVRAKQMVTQMDKNALLADVKTVAAATAQPKVLVYVKELAAKAAVQSKSSSLAREVSQEGAMQAARDAAGQVAQSALDEGQGVVLKAAKEAVEAAITGAAASRMADSSETTPSTIARGIESAIDSAGSTGDEAATKQAAKQAIINEVQHASSAASKEAAAKGKSKKEQNEAANKAATDAMRKGRDVQQVVNNVTEQKQYGPDHEIHVIVEEAPHPAKNADAPLVVAPRNNLEPKAATKAPPTAGNLVLEAIETRDSSEKMVSHLQLRLQSAARSAAETAAHEAAGQGRAKAKAAARRAAKLAAKSAVLAEVRDAAITAATRAKDALQGRDIKAQADAASAAASQAAQNVLAIAKGIVDAVAMNAARKALTHLSNKNIEADDALLDDIETDDVDIADPDDIIDEDINRDTDLDEDEID